jgi:peroxin-16
MCRASAHRNPASLTTTRHLTRVNDNDIFNPSPYSHRCTVHKMANLPNGTMGERLKVATRKANIKDILSLPPKWLSLYSDFITKNQSSVTSIESALRSLTYIIPGRFRDAELASESLHSSIQLLSLYHDTLLLRAISKLPGVPTQQSPHNRYTKFWIQKSKFYRRVAMTLSVVQYTELLWEMMAKRKGEKVRWRIVIVLEIVKAVCRLLLMRITNSRPLVSPPLPEREVIPEEAVEEEEEDGFRDEGFHEERERPLREKEYKMKRTGLSLPVLPNPSDISSYLLSKVLTADDIKAAPSLLNSTRGSAQLAEILHILQPVIYAVAMSRSKDKRNWQPWLLGLSIEYAARQLRKDGLRTTSLEREQWSKRGWAMGWWAMRGAFYENVTKGFLHKTSERLPSLISGVLDDYLYLWDGYYFSTSSN